MNNSKKLAWFFWSWVSATGSCYAQKTNMALSRPEIQKIIAGRVNAISAGENSLCIIAGIIGPGGRQVISYGHLDKNDKRLPESNTVFEIGSVTKIFTALLLADMVNNGEIRLNDPAAKYLPDSVKLPEFKGHPISVLDLVTHTSGLPFMPPLEIKSRDEIYKYLASYKLTTAIGTDWEYSNIGFWLLSEVLASRSKMSFEELLQERILSILHLKNTRFSFSGEMISNLAIGHDANLQHAPVISSVPAYSLMPAAGGLFSCTDDLMELLAVALGYKKSSLSGDIITSLGISRPIEKSNKKQSLGWVIIKEKDDSLIYHDGGTFGYASCLMFDAKAKTGVVVLSNQTNAVDDIAHHILRPDYPLKNPIIIKHKEILIDSALLDKYTGKFEADKEGIFIIRRSGDVLTFEAPSDWGMPLLPVHPENMNDFFAYELPLHVTFKRDSINKINRMIIFPPRGQKAIQARRINQVLLFR